MLFLSKKNVPIHEIIPDGYVDIHSHLLAGIDDGVKTVFQSAYILEEFEKIGIKKCITTPHVMQDIWPNSSLIIKRELSRMQQVLKKLSIHTIELRAGAEYMLDDLFYQQIKAKDIMPIHQNYILVELSYFSAPINLKEIMFEIKLAGYTPILAHPERYSYYHNDFKKYDELKELGFLFQLNLLSVSGFYGETIKKTVLKMVEAEYMDFTGTDIHNYHQLEVFCMGYSARDAKKIIPVMEKNILFS